jgi:hypothetical protein
MTRKYVERLDKKLTDEYNNLSDSEETKKNKIFRFKRRLLRQHQRELNFNFTKHKKKLNHQYNNT